MALWLGRFENVLPLRGRGPLHLYSSRTQDGAQRVVMVAAPSVPAAKARQYLDDVAAVHAVLRSPLIPSVAERGEASGTEFLAFDSPAITDMEYIVERFLGADEPRLPYEQALALPLTLGQVLSHAHRARDPRTGGPVCIRALSLRNVLVSGEGQLSIIGFAHNPALLTEEKVLGAVPGVFHAPELAAGGKPTPGSDLYAMFMLVQSLMAFVAIPPALERVYQGEATPADGEVVNSLQWAVSSILAAPAPAREQSVERAMEMYARAWGAMGCSPDFAGFSTFLMNLQRREIPTHEPGSGAGVFPSDALVVENGGAWFRLPSGERYTMEKRAPLRRVLLRLVEKRIREPGEPVRLDDLLDAGWPGERPLPEAGANRVYVALSNLRSLGLKEAIRRTGEGWLIDKQLRVEWAG